MRIPKLFHLRADPFERGEESTLFYDKWFADRAFLQVPAQAFAAQWLDSFKEFPIRQKPASFNLDRVIEKLMPSVLGATKKSQITVVIVGGAFDGASPSAGRVRLSECQPGIPAGMRDALPRIPCSPSG